MLKVLEGKNLSQKGKVIELEKRKQRHMAYKRVFFSMNCPVLKRLYAGVRYVNTYELTPSSTEEELRDLLTIIDVINILFASQPLSVIMNLYPIDKYYDGQKFQCKDYFTTMDYLKGMDASKPVSDVEGFLWSYYNSELMRYGIKQVLVLDELLKRSGRKTLAEAFSEAFDVPTYHYDKKKQTMTNNRTGEVFQVKKSAPSYLKVIQ